MVKGKAKQSTWTTSVGDFDLWQHDGEEEREERRPFLKASHPKDEITVRHQHQQSEAQQSSDVPVTASPRQHDVRGKGKAKEISLLDEGSAKSSTTLSHRLNSDPTTPTLKRRNLPSSSALNSSIDSTRKPWEFAKKMCTQQPVSIAYNLPECVVQSDSTDDRSLAIAGSEAFRAENLPAYAFRKPAKVKSPSQQTICIPMSDVCNAESSVGDYPTPKRDSSNTYPSTNSTSQAKFKAHRDLSSSCSTTSSRIFEGRSSSSSSKTLATSSPRSFTQFRSYGKRRPYASKQSYQNRSSSCKGRLRPAKVVYTRGNTNQSRLSFAPIATPQASSVCEEYAAALSPSFPDHPCHRGQVPLQDLPPPSVDNVLRSPRQPHWIGDSTRDHYSGAQHARITSTKERLMSPTLPRNLLLGSRSRSEMEQAIDREFCNSFRDSPMQERIAADYQAFHEGSDRRVRQYPDVFDQDPAQSLKQTKQKLSHFDWNTTSSTVRHGAAKAQLDLPSAPRLGVASKARKNAPQRSSSIICISSDDEFDAEFGQVALGNDELALLDGELL
ncbi:hypothetical protein CBS101457_006176 [Exobasidium rhododendri]|nr:hypothetical protein CBS101457_006176 [Exobasidium rhododendri]